MSSCRSSAHDHLSRLPGLILVIPAIGMRIDGALLDEWECGNTEVGLEI